LVKDNAAYGVSLLILQINQVFSITENYGANLTVIGRWNTLIKTSFMQCFLLPFLDLHKYN